MAHLIVMLTRNDLTVSNAKEVFDSCKDLPVEFWGFKDNGISLDEMKILAKDMKDAGKKVVFELLGTKEDECISGAKHAVEIKADYMMGGVFFPSVSKILSDNNIKYYPYIGNVLPDPVIISSTPEEIAKEIEILKSKGCEGVTLLAYENEKEHPLQVMDNFFGRKELNCIVAGAVNSKGRMIAILSYGMFGFACGSSFFKGDFCEDKSFRAQVKAISDFLIEDQSAT